MMSNWDWVQYSVTSATCKMKMEKMEVDSPRESNRGTPKNNRGTPSTPNSNRSTPKLKENYTHLKPISPDKSGEGLPYAPINWPNPGDIWKWKVGKRVSSTGHYLDRYLYPPRSLRHKVNLTCNRNGFISKISVKRFFEASFPNADIDEFFASFSWKIPAKQSLTNVPPKEMAVHSASDTQSISVSCKAGNKMCSSLVQAENPSLLSEISPLVAMPCNICCSEPRFCRDCCCILCCKTVDSAHGGYNYIKCEAIVDEDYICGHVAHMDCALRCYMAGTIGGRIGLDAEYYCRRCDARTDLVSYVKKLLQTSESIDSHDDIEKILKIGIFILRGSLKASAKELLSCIELANPKLKCGAYLEDLWKVEDNNSQSAVPTGFFGHENAALEVDPLNVRTRPVQNMSVSSNHQIRSLKLESEIDQALLALRKSQESEYKIAEERLLAQKNYLQNLYQLLDKEKFELACYTSTIDRDDELLNAVLRRSDQIKREVAKLKDMEEVAKGFGKTSKDILKEHFGLEN